MSFKHLLERANIEAIESFLLYGGESRHAPSEKTYAERLSEARKKATAFFQSRYTDIDEYDEIAGYFDEHCAVFEAVYFEIGLLLGAKIAYRIRGKMEDLT